MAIIITEECINCGACEPECPNTAIYEGGAEWAYSDGTSLSQIELEDGSFLDASESKRPLKAVLLVLMVINFIISCQQNVQNVLVFTKNHSVRLFAR